LKPSVHAKVDPEDRRHPDNEHRSANKTREPAHRPTGLSNGAVGLRDHDGAKDNKQHEHQRLERI
jgi:hypothetical protein